MAGIYIHIPFCRHACHYCDFHFSTSFKTKNQIIQSINKELILKKNYLYPDIVSTIYFGGGTPSVLEEIDIDSILNVILSNFLTSESPEVTIELNPDDVNSEKIKKYISLGINRFSVGGQSFQDEQLIRMNRKHTSLQVENSIKLIQGLGINNINLDLIYGLPKMTNRDWLKNLQKAVRLDVPHLSCYNLTIEPKTVFHKMLNSGDLKLGSDFKIKSEFLIMRNFLKKNGFIHYEISNFSKPKYQSKHNTAYWNGEKYLGVGPSAHSYNGYSRQWNVNNNIKYINSIQCGESFFEEEVLTNKNIINEHILTGLRTNKGFSLNRLIKRLTSLEKKSLIHQIHCLKEKSLIKVEKNRVFLTEEGMILCDKITSDLFLV